MTDVLIPFAGDCPQRRRAFDWVVRVHWEAGRNVIVGTADTDEWCKAEAIADALGRSDSDVIVLADADVWSANLEQSIAAVGKGAGWSVPHWNVCRLTEDGTAEFLAGNSENPESEERHIGVLGGGIVALRRETYERVPLDRRFIGWGGEDQAWGYALNAIVGPVIRFREPLIHLWHPPQPRRSRRRGSKATQALLARYYDQRTHPGGMEALIEEARCHSNASSQPTR